MSQVYCSADKSIRNNIKWLRMLHTRDILQSESFFNLPGCKNQQLSPLYCLNLTSVYFKSKIRLLPGTHTSCTVLSWLCQRLFKHQDESLLVNVLIKFCFYDQVRLKCFAFKIEVFRIKITSFFFFYLSIITAHIADLIFGDKQLALCLR